MIWFHNFGRVASSFAVVGLILFPSLRLAADEPVTGAPTEFIDVALDEGNLLHGQIVSRSATAVDGGQVLLLHDGLVLGMVQANHDGRFAIRLQQGGFYQLATEYDLVSFRAWTKQAAPPRAQHEVVLSTGDVARGQQGRIPFGRQSPWLIAGVVAAAVAIPVVLHNYRDDRGDGS